MNEEWSEDFKAWLADGNASGCNHSMWKAWQASRIAIVIQLPPLEKSQQWMSDFDDGSVSGNNSAIESMKYRLTSAGVSIK